MMTPNGEASHRRRLQTAALRVGALPTWFAPLPAAGPQRTGQILCRPQRRGRHPSFICIRMYPLLKDRFVVGPEALCQHVDVGGHEREAGAAERVSARVPVGGAHLHLAGDVGVADQLGPVRSCRPSITRVVSSMAAQRPRGIAFMKSRRWHRIEAYFSSARKTVTESRYAND
jgi:hypothetical protein